jgi:hypothetical protein
VSRPYIPFTVEARRRYRRTYLQRHPTGDRDSHLRRRFGLTPTQYDAKFAEQGEVCAICHRPETSTWRGKVRRLGVDHDHETGAIRGLLCTKCNRGLGWFDDEADLLVAAAQYVRAYA